jgi:hypothetical protein
MTVAQADKARKFRALHEAPGVFVICHPRDAGSTRILAGLGFQAARDLERPHRNAFRRCEPGDFPEFAFRDNAVYTPRDISRNSGEANGWGSVYGFLQGAWPFGIIMWACVAFRRWYTGR